MADIYSDFDNYNPNLDAQDLENDPVFQHAVQTSHGRRQPTAAGRGFGARLKTGAQGPAGIPPKTGMMGVADGGARPMTAVRAAGFTAHGKRGFDPMSQTGRGPAPPLEQKNEDTPEEKIKATEKQVNKLIEESCFANSRGELQVALDKAKEAGRKERVLVGLREQLASSDTLNLDLTYSVLFNLANQYAANEMYAEALNTYQVIVKNKMFSNAGRLKVNMGNIYFMQKQYSKAVKMYRMALDQVPNINRELRTKIMSNIGIVFVKMGQYQDAITSFEHIMNESPDFKTGFNLLLCYYAMGDKERMRRGFQRLLTVDLRLDDEDKYIPNSDDKQYNLLLEVIKSDSLREIEKDKKTQAERSIKYAAKIISPAVASSFAEGYDWCIEQVKISPYMDLAHELEIDKAIMYLKQKDFKQAIGTLKSFERKDTKVASIAATNLSFLYFLEKDLAQAEKYAEVAMQADRYNPSALVNRGNVLFVKDDKEKAREYYREALNNDSSCIEALYNLGLCNKRLNRLEDALNCFYKLHNIIKGHPQVAWQIADIYDQLRDTSQTTEWMMQVAGMVATDPTLLNRLGEFCDREGDKSQAFQYYYDSYRFYPSHIETIEWLGAYYIESQFSEKAIQYFERAALVQPQESNWQLMVASCHRRAGNYQQALETYKTIHRRFPDNVECLRFLVRLCSDLGLPEAQDYATKLKKAEKHRDQREHNRVTSAQRTGSGRRRITATGEGRDGSAGSDTGVNGRRQRDRPKPALDGNESYQAPQQGEVDATYSDPLGPQAERPKTAATRRQDAGDEFANEELGDDLLPE